MTDPQKLHADATHLVLHAWVMAYLGGRAATANGDTTTLATQLQTQAGKLRESTEQLAAALEKMRIANAKLAQRMAEHKAFFAKYRRPE
jgi:DNA anti-recombination protein RmuC